MTTALALREYTEVDAMRDELHERGVLAAGSGKYQRDAFDNLDPYIKAIYLRGIEAYLDAPKFMGPR